jgi:hypothetical protein
VLVSAQAAAAWDGDEPDYERQWPACTGKWIDRTCALLWDTPPCCHVPRLGHGHANGGGEYEGSAHPYSSQGDVTADAAVDGKLMGYWLGKDFYCRK